MVFLSPVASVKWLLFSTIGLPAAARSRLVAGLLAALAISLLGWTTPLSAQDQGKKKAAAAGPEDVTLTTDDSLKLVLSYYAGNNGQESTPVLLLHGFRGSRKDFTKDNGLASYLQEKLGCAVIVPDLRGHGESTAVKGGKPLKAETLQPRQFSLMTTQDLRAIKNFLWEKNNAKELNIDKLCVIGTEMGASLALIYAADDAQGYEQMMSAYGPLKLGQFVRLMVLISPDTSVRGLTTNINKALAMPVVKNSVPVMLLVGGKGNNSRLTDTERLFKIITRARGPVPEDADAVTVWYKKLDTSLQGIKLVDEESLRVPERIGKVLTALLKRLDAKKYAWKLRKAPHE